MLWQLESMMRRNNNCEVGYDPMRCTLCMSCEEPDLLCCEVKTVKRLELLYSTRTFCWLTLTSVISTQEDRNTTAVGLIHNTHTLLTHTHTHRHCIHHPCLGGGSAVKAGTVCESHIKV